jgi:hypothetical protein
MLCSKNFGVKDAWLRHVDEEHGSLSDYRQRLFFLHQQFENVGPVAPQLWRHIVEAYSEDFTTGRPDWHGEFLGWTEGPDTSYTWPQLQGIPPPTQADYAVCAERIVRGMCGDKPWETPTVNGRLLDEQSRSIVRGVLEEHCPPGGDVGSDVTDAVVVAVADMFVERLKAEEKLYRLPSADVAASEVYMLCDRLRLSLWSWSLLQSLPFDREFSADEELRSFLQNRLSVEPDTTCLQWARSLLQHLDRLKVVENVLPSTDATSDLHVAGDTWRRRRWWLPQTTDQPLDMSKPSVRLENLHGHVAANHGHGDGRRAVRARVPCAVCARLGWDRTYGYMWEQPEGSERSSVVGLRRCRASDSRRAGTDTQPGASSSMSDAGDDSWRKGWQALFDPEAYYQRWRFSDNSGGIPWSELEASSVRDPKSGEFGCYTRKCSQ